MIEDPTSIVTLVAQILDLGITGVLTVGVIALWLRLRWTQNQYSEYQKTIAEEAEKRAQEALADYKQMVMQNQTYIPSGMNFPQGTVPMEFNTGGD